MGWRPGPLNVAQLVDIFRAAGLTADEAALRGDVGECATAEDRRDFLVAQGQQIQLIVQDYIDNLGSRDQRWPIDNDVEDLTEAIELTRIIFDRIRDNSCGGRDRDEVGLQTSMRAWAEEGIARWFDEAWEVGVAGDPPFSTAFARLEWMVAELTRRSADLPGVRTGRPPVPTSRGFFITQVADVFERLTGQKANAPKASGDRRDGELANGSERSSKFVKFLHAICSHAGCEAPKNQSVRRVLQARAKQAIFLRK